jgi:hypothetical protein
VPYPVKADKQKHQQSDNHTVVAQLGLTGWCMIAEVKNLFKIDQIQKFDQRQKPAERA